MENRIAIAQTKRILPDLLYKEEVYAIIGAAFDAHNQLGAGFLESVYQEALEIELKRRNILYQSQPELHIYYRDQVLTKTFRPDLVVENKIIVEIKANEQLCGADEAQLLNYLHATKMKLGLLINFGSTKLEWRRRILNKK
jgi:GxxExxY protein